MLYQQNLLKKLIAASRSASVRGGAAETAACVGAVGVGSVTAGGGDIANTVVVVLVRF